jgi:hypothetical protein
MTFRIWTTVHAPATLKNLCPQKDAGAVACATVAIATGIRYHNDRVGFVPARNANRRLQCGVAAAFFLTHCNTKEFFVVKTLCSCLAAAVLIVSVAFSAQADQCEAVSKKVAEKAVSILKNRKNKDVYSYCKPCGDKAATRVTPRGDIKYKRWKGQSGENLYEVHVDGSPNGPVVDLAYLYVDYENLGIKSGCNPTGVPGKIEIIKDEKKAEEKKEESGAQEPDQSKKSKKKGIFRRR